MKKVSNSFGSSRVQSNLLEQNCFVRDVTRKSDLCSSSSPSSFLSIDEVVTKNGVSLVEKEYPYPITPQYVNSFVESSDYHNDPLNAISQSHKGSNLGDIRDIQTVSNMDSESARVLYNQLKERFSQVDNTSDNTSDNTFDNNNGGNI